MGCIYNTVAGYLMRGTHSAKENTFYILLLLFFLLLLFYWIGSVSCVCVCVYMYKGAPT